MRREREREKARDRPYQFSVYQIWKDKVLHNLTTQIIKKNHFVGLFVSHPSLSVLLWDPLLPLLEALSMESF